MLLGSISTNPALVSGVVANPEATSTVASTTAPINGTIPGTNISYEYGVNTFNAHDSFQVANNGTAQDSYNNQMIQNLTLNLVNISSVQPQLFYYKVVQSVYYPTFNTSIVLNMDNNTFQNVYVPKLNASFSGLVRVLGQDNGSLVDTAIVTTQGEYLGTFPTNSTIIYGYVFGANINITVSLEITAFVISYQSIPTPVQLNVTQTVQAYLAYYNAYNITYNIHAEQWYAKITDGNRMGMYVSAFKNLNINYTQIQYSVLDYYIASSLNVSLRYMNGTNVPFEDMPFALRPAYFSQNGSIEDLNINFENSTSIVASTTAVQAFQAKLTKNIGTNAQVSANAFTAWMVSSVPRLLAYQDGNLNGQLDLQYDPLSGLQTSSGDYVSYIGALEATKGDAISYHKYNQTYDQTILSFEGFQFINQTQKGLNSVSEGYQVYHKAFGISNTTAPPSFNPYWNGYTNTSGTYNFNFGVQYQNFPVNWVNMQNQTDQSIVPMNITYDYVYSINPAMGNAKLSPTITYGAIINPTLKAKFVASNLSLATMYESDFLSATLLQATRVEITSGNVTSSVAAGFSAVSFAGSGNNFTSIDTAGKANYTLDSIPYTSHASVLNLVSFSGSATATNVTVFQSNNANIMNSALMKQVTTTSTLNLNYRKDLILISYPQWSGGQIVHDPSFSAVYQPTVPQITSATADTTANVGNVVVLQWVVKAPNNNPGTYKITDSTGKVVDSGNWYSGETISYSFPVVQGSNSYTLTIYDTAGNPASKTITITGQQDTTTPTTTSPVTTTPPLSTSSTPKLTSAAPGFTVEAVSILSLVSLMIIYKRRNK